MDLDPVHPSDAETERNRGATSPSASLNDLPVEILMQIASSLDYWSLLSLEHVSERCRDAVVLHFSLVRVLDMAFDKSGSFRDSEWMSLSRAQKALLLSRLTGLCELYVYVSNCGDVQWLLEAMLTASTGWSRLERMRLSLCRDVKFDATVLGQICSNCPRLTYVSFCLSATDEAVEAVLKARHGELHSLDLDDISTLLPGRLAAALSDCIRLERLRLKNVISVVGCLPSGGLCALRRLGLTDCCLTDADVAWLAERQPDLEMLILNGCAGLCRRCGESSGIDSVTRSGLQQLGRLTALRYLTLEYVTGLSDELLRLLSKMPLKALRVKGWPEIWDHVSAWGLYRLTQESPFLRLVTLSNEYDPSDKDTTIDCMSRVLKKQDLLGILELRDLLLILEQHITSDEDIICCHISAALSGVAE